MPAPAGSVTWPTTEANRVWAIDGAAQRQSASTALEGVTRNLVYTLARLYNYRLPNVHPSFAGLLVRLSRSRRAPVLVALLGTACSVLLWQATQREHRRQIGV